MEIDGELIIESADIMKAIEERFPDSNPLLPAKGTPERQRAEILMRFERQVFSDSFRWMTSSWWVWE